MKLNVSAAFHSKYMIIAQDKLTNEIDKIVFKASNIPIISNYDADINYNIDKVIISLKNQMASKVKWTESIKKLEQTNVSEIIVRPSVVVIFPPFIPLYKLPFSNISNSVTLKIKSSAEE